MDTPNLQFEKDYSSPLISRWWILVLAFVLIYGFAVLITVTYKAYDGRPPIPETVTDSEGNLLFTGNDIREGQSVFLRYGLHDNGSRRCLTGRSGILSNSQVPLRKRMSEHYPRQDAR
mgnify:CR=1 FL=1